MSKTLLLMLCLLTGLLVLACSKTAETNRNVTAPSATNSSAPASTPATTTSAGDKIGIEECDSFIASYESCVSTKVPEAARAQYKTAINTGRPDDLAFHKTLDVLKNRIAFFAPAADSGKRVVPSTSR